MIPPCRLVDRDKLPSPWDRAKLSSGLAHANEGMGAGREDKLKLNIIILCLSLFLPLPGPGSTLPSTPSPMPPVVPGLLPYTLQAGGSGHVPVTGQGWTRLPQEA